MTSKDSHYQAVIPKGFDDPRQRNGRVAGAILAVGFLVFLLASAYSAMKLGEPNAVILIGIGVLGIWRHSWNFLNFVRAKRFIRLPRHHMDLSNKSKLIVVVTVYNQSNAEVYAVAKSLSNATCKLPNKTLVVFAYRENIHRTIMMQVADENPGMVVHYVIQAGLGKREALGNSLVIARRILPLHSFENCSLLLMDGDTVTTEKAITESMKTLGARPDIGAVVVNEIPYIKGRGLFATWRLLRSFQRNKLMSCFSLSDRTLVLTGRFAMFRADILLQIDVISRIRKDYLQTHDVYVPLLTGDDKTTWLEVLRRGYGMTYLPDVYVYPIEVAPVGRSSLAGIIPLTARYAGNMARANLHLDAWKGTKGKLHFAYGLLDQRISMWTSLLSPIVLLYLLLFASFDLFIIFLAYVIVIKHLQSLMIAHLSGHYDPRFPYLMLFDQIVQSAIKIQAFAYLHRQSWNNQSIKAVAGPEEQRLNAMARRSLSLRLVLFLTTTGYILAFAR